MGLGFGIESGIVELWIGTKSGIFVVNGWYGMESGIVESWSDVWIGTAQWITIIMITTKLAQCGGFG